MYLAKKWFLFERTKKSVFQKATLFVARSWSSQTLRSADARRRSRSSERTGEDNDQVALAVPPSGGASTNGLQSGPLPCIGYGGKSKRHRMPDNSLNRPARRPPTSDCAASIGEPWDGKP